MRKMWLLPIVGTIGNFFSVVSLVLLPLGFISFLAYGLLVGRVMRGNSTLAMCIVIGVDLLLILSYQAFLFYKGVSGKGTKDIEKYYESRPLNNEEHNLLAPLAQEVIDRHNKLNNINWTFGKEINITIEDSEDMSNISFGLNRIILTTEILKYADAEIIKSVLAFHIARLYSKASLIDLTNYLVHSPTRTATAHIKASSLTSDLKALKNKPKFDDRSIKTLVKKAILLPAVIIGGTVGLVCNMIQKILNQQEVLDHDAYVVKLGYGERFLKFLEATQQYTVSKNPIAKFFESYPDIKLRIENVKSALANK